LDALAALPPGKSSEILGPRAGLDDVEKRKFFTLPGLKLHIYKIKHEMLNFVFGENTNTRAIRKVISAYFRQLM
jgi:hypothetical protein